MYKEGDKALVMVTDKDLLNQVKKYLLKRYYLVVESAKDIFEVYKKFENEDMSYELVIIDDTAAGLPTSAHAFKTLKEKSETIVLHLSTLVELVDSNYSSQLRQLKKYPDEIMEEKENEFVGKILKVYRPIFYSPTLVDVYQDYCKTLVEMIDVDNAACVMLRLDEKPLRRGTVMAQYPDIDQEPYEIPLEGSQQLETMVEYFKPVHIPDLNKDEAFRSELLEKFSFPYGSVLMVPIEMNGICLGFFSMFTQKTRRLYRLDDIALSVYTAHVAAGAIVHKFLTEHLHVDMDSKFREYFENPNIFSGRRNLMWLMESRDVCSSVQEPCSDVPDTCRGHPEPCSGLPDTCSGVPEPCSSVPDTCSGLPEPCSGVPEACSGLPETCSSVPETCSGLPEPCSGVPEACSSVPDTCSGLPEPCSGVPEACSGLPEPCSGVPDTCSGVSEPCKSVCTVCFVQKNQIKYKRRFNYGLSKNKYSNIFSGLQGVDLWSEG